MGSKRWTPRRLRSEGDYGRARILTTAVHLKLFDWLGKEAKSFRAARGHFGGTAQGWEIFLDALTAMGLLRKRAKRYQNSVFSLRHLCSGKSAFLLSRHDSWEPWGSLADILTTGRRPKISQPFFTDRKRAERLLRALHQDARRIAPYLLRRLPLGRAQTLLDLCGGLGSFTLACCRRFPHLRATLVEHPRVVPFARRAVKNADMANRVQVVGIDILKDPLPAGFDIALLSNVLHGQGFRQNRALLKNVCRSLNPGGRLILRDVWLTRDRTAPEWGALFSVELLLHTRDGRCYALDEIRRWLRHAGFSSLQGPFRSSPLSFDPDSVLIAVKR
jgi:SAM-dependent methyltransferase